MRCTAIFLASIIALAVGGCGESDTVKVTGTVTYDGAPADQAEILFTPKVGRPASAVVDSQGKFVLSTSSEGDGAVPGEHTVVVFDYYPAGKAPPMGGNAPTRYPANYGNPEQSPFRATVERGKTNDFLFEMKQ